jgi:hypothetical protein
MYRLWRARALFQINGAIRRQITAFVIYHCIISCSESRQPLMADFRRQGRRDDRENEPDAERLQVFVEAVRILWPARQ